MGARPGLGHAGLAGYGHRPTPCRSPRPVLTRPRSGHRPRDDPPQLRARQRSQRREGHQDPPHAPRLARPGNGGDPHRIPSTLRGFARQLDGTPTDSTFLFSYEATYDRPYDPSGVSHRYARMCANIGIDSHLHALRHYSATELLAAGVDLRTVAGQLGHAGGGATTLRVYAAWVGEADRRAVEILGSRVQRPGTDTYPL